MMHFVSMAKSHHKDGLLMARDVAGICRRLVAIAGLCVALTPPCLAVPPPKELTVFTPALVAPPVPLTSDFAVTPHFGAGFMAAPVPDYDQVAPSVASPSGATLSPKMLPRPNVYRGDGYTPASMPDVEQKNKKVEIPGISLKVPLY